MENGKVEAAKDTKSTPESNQHPKRSLTDRRTGVYINGVEVTRAPIKDLSPRQHITDIINAEIRDDDILLVAYAKSGTHWIWEVVQMLLHQTTTHAVRSKEHVMMEFVPVSLLNQQSSPRVLNTHLYFAHLPTPAILAKKTKILHVVRNPKDVLTSMFHHFSTFLELTWPMLIEEMLEEAGNIKNQFRFLRQVHEFQQQYPDHPVKLVYYEDMKKNPAKVAKEVADFLAFPVSEEFCQEVADACSFDNLKSANTNKELPEHLEEALKFEKNKFYRKGIIGDWKNHFTVAQNEQFDAFIEEKSKGLPFRFTYE